METRAAKFLWRWCERHIEGKAFAVNRKDGELLAHRCLADAKQAGVTAGEVHRAADDDLAGYMFDAINKVAETLLDISLRKSRIRRLIREEWK
jgi:hypothetical protein